MGYPYSWVNTRCANDGRIYTPISGTTDVQIAITNGFFRRISFLFWRIRELGSNYLLISRDFKICMVIRAIYFKVFALANR